MLVASSAPSTKHELLWRVYLHLKGLERQGLIGSAVAGFNHALTVANDSAKNLDARQVNYNKGIYFPGSLVNNPVI